MTDEMTVVIRFKDVPESDELRDELEKRCRHFAAEFPETTRYEVTLSPTSPEVFAQTHVTGKGTDIAAHASASEPRQAAERALDKLERELRREHDKRIFGRRREAQRAVRKRTS